MRIYQRVIFSALLLGIFTLSACTQYGTRPPVSAKPVSKPVIKEQAWQQRQRYLASKPAWNLQSKISLRFDDENWIFGLNWAQLALAQYVMQISNPLTGALVAKLNRNQAGVSLLADDGKTYRDTDEERLLLSQSGLRLPVKGMQYWVRGLTAPQYKVEQLNLDNQGRPQTIYQAGWKINFTNYDNNNYNAMPSRVVLTRPADKLYLKVVAKRWQGV